MEWTGARYADKPTVQVSTHIDLPPDEVWPVIADPLLMPQLSTELQSVEWLDGADRAAVGARFRGLNRHEALGEWATTSTVIECDPPRLFGWAIEDVQQPSAVWRFMLEPADGGTRVTQWVQLGPGRSGLSLAIDAMPENEQKIVFVRLREFERGMQANLEQLKQRLEGASA